MDDGGITAEAVHVDFPAGAEAQTPCDAPFADATRRMLISAAERVVEPGNLIRLHDGVAVEVVPDVIVAGVAFEEFGLPVGQVVIAQVAVPELLLGAIDGRRGLEPADRRYGPVFIAAADHYRQSVPVAVDQELFAITIDEL